MAPYSSGAATTQPTQPDYQAGGWDASTLAAQPSWGGADGGMPRMPFSVDTRDRWLRHIIVKGGMVGVVAGLIVAAVFVVKDGLWHTPAPTSRTPPARIAPAPYRAALLGQPMTANPESLRVEVPGFAAEYGVAVAGVPAAPTGTVTAVDRYVSGERVVTVLTVVSPPGDVPTVEVVEKRLAAAEKSVVASCSCTFANSAVDGVPVRVAVGHPPHVAATTVLYQPSANAVVAVTGRVDVDAFAVLRALFARQPPPVPPAAPQPPPA